MPLFLGRAARILLAAVLAIASFLFVLFGVILMLTDRSDVTAPELFLVFSAGLVLIGAGLGYAAFQLTRRDISAARAALAEHQSDIQKRHEKELREGRKPATWFTFVLVLLFALGVGWALAPGVLQGLRSTNWPLLEAKVIDSRLVDATKKSIRSEVTYTYTVGGRTYTSDQTSFHFFFRDPVGVVERSPKGTIVQVAVNPADAEEAVLEPGISWIDAGTLALLWSGCISAFIQAIASRRRRRADGR